MKKTPYLLIPLLALASCGTTPIPSSSDSAPSSDSSNEEISSSENAPRQAVSPKEAYSQLKKLAKATSYHLVSGIGSDSYYEEWLTPSYYYNTSLGYGYLLKESFDPQYGSSIAYSFSLEGDEVKLSGPSYSYPNGKLTYVNDLSTLYRFSAYEDYKDKIESSSFETDENGDAYSQNKYVVRLFAAALGYVDDDSLKQIDRVYFYRQNGEFGFALQKTTIFGFYLDVGDTYSRIGDLGTASHPILDSYCATHYSIGKQALTESNLALLDSSSKNITLHNEAHVLIGGEDQGVNLASELILGPDKAERITIDPSTEETISDLISRHEDGYAYEIGYDEKGKVSEKLYEKYLAWDDLVPNLKNKLLEEKECFRLEEGRYVYYGRLSNRLKDFFGQMDGIRGIAERMALTVDANGQVNGAEFEFAQSQYSDSASGTSFVYRYRLECSVVEVKSFTVLNDLSDDQKVPEIDAAIAEFDGSKPYAVTFQDSLADSPSERIVYRDGVYVDTQYSTTLAGDVTSSEGYYQKGDAVQPFLSTTDGAYYAKADSAQGDIASYSPHSLNSALFLKKGDAYVLRDHTLAYVSRGLPLNYNASLVFPETLSVTLDKQGRFASMSYVYDWDVVNSRQEEVTFTYGNSVSLPEGLSASLENLGDFQMPTSWEEEDPSILEDLQKLYGDEAKNVPYLYLASTYKKWDSSYSIAETVQLSNSSTGGEDSAFFASYREALQNAGFTLAETPTLPGAEEWNLGKIKVRLAKILRGGLYFSLND